MEWIFWIIVIFVVLGFLGNSEEKKKQDAAKIEAERRRKEAEDFILNSGDQEAIKALMLARANPANYNQTLAAGMNKGNDTLKMALGVMTGVIAGNLISNAITVAAIDDALANMQTNFDAASLSSVSDSSFTQTDSAVYESETDVDADSSIDI